MAVAVSTWRATRCGSVSSPISCRYALNGLCTAPNVRRYLTRMRLMNASEPNAPEKLRRLPSMSAMTCSGRVNCRKSAVRPVEPSGVDDHAADGVAMPGDALGGRMHNDVGAEFDRAQQVRRRHGVVENQRQPVPVRQIGQRTNIGDGGVRVGDRLGEDGTGRGTDQRLDSFTQVVDVLRRNQRGCRTAAGSRRAASTDAPYRFVGAMMRPPPSPAHISAYDTAAMPDDTATALTPPSRAASRRSSASTVGSATLEYSNPEISPAARSRPRAAFSKSKAAEA